MGFIIISNDNEKKLDPEFSNIMSFSWCFYHKDFYLAQFDLSVTWTSFLESAIFTYPADYFSIHHSRVIIDHCTNSDIQIYSQLRHNKESSENHLGQNVSLGESINSHFTLEKH